MASSVDGTRPDSSAVLARNAMTSLEKENRVGRVSASNQIPVIDQVVGQVVGTEL